MVQHSNQRGHQASGLLQQASQNSSLQQAYIANKPLGQNHNNTSNDNGQQQQQRVKVGAINSALIVNSRNMTTRNRTSLNSHVSHSHFNSINSQNSHHNHHYSQQHHSPSLHHLNLSSSSSISSQSSCSSASSASSTSSTSVSPSNNLNHQVAQYHHHHLNNNNDNNSINNINSGNCNSNSSINSNSNFNNISNNINNISQNGSGSSTSSSCNSSTGIGSSGQQNSSRYKTELCRPYEENGTCKYGEKCQFAHGIGELRTLTRHPKYKTEFCRTFHTTGFCPYGPRCHFIHNSKAPSNSIPVTGVSSHSLLSNGLGSFSTGHFAGNGSSTTNSPSTSPVSSRGGSNCAGSSGASGVLCISPGGSSPLGCSNSSAASTSSQVSISTSPAPNTSCSAQLDPLDQYAALAQISEERHQRISLRQPTTSGLQNQSAEITRLVASIGIRQQHQQQRISQQPEDHNQNQHQLRPIGGQKNESNDLAGGSSSSSSRQAACAGETQSFFWLHSHMNGEGSRWTPSICASGLISGANSRRTWQMQA